MVVKDRKDRSEVYPIMHKAEPIRMTVTLVIRASGASRDNILLLVNIFAKLITYW